MSFFFVVALSNAITNPLASQLPNPKSFTDRWISFLLNESKGDVVEPVMLQSPVIKFDGGEKADVKGDGVKEGTEKIDGGEKV